MALLEDFFLVAAEEIKIFKRGFNSFSFVYLIQEIKPAVAKATSDALAACKCAGPTKPASSSASSSSTATATTGGAATDSSKTELPSFNTDFPDFPDFPEMNFPNFDMPEFPEMGQFP